MIKDSVHFLVFINLKVLLLFKTKKALFIMKNLKISIASIAFIFAMGVTYVTNAADKPTANDCALTAGGSANYDSANCGTPGGTTCCYIPGTSTVFDTKLP